MENEITTDNTEIQKIIRDYYQQLYANKMDNLAEMVKYSEKYNFTKLNQEVNILITSTDIETVIKNLPTKKTQDQMTSQLNSTKNLEQS